MPKLWMNGIISPSLSVPKSRQDKLAYRFNSRAVDVDKQGLKNRTRAGLLDPQVHTDEKNKEFTRCGTHSPLDGKTSKKPRKKKVEELHGRNNVQPENSMKYKVCIWL